MELSVIIPSYNEYPALKNLLSYLKNIDTVNNIEIIIVCSAKNSDNTPTLTEVKILSCPYHSRASQMNFGALEAKGEVLMFLHADVLPPKSFYTDISSEIKDGNDFGFFAYKFYPSSFLLKMNALFTRRDGLFAGGGDQIHFMTKSLFCKLGGYDESLSIMEDFDFVKRYRQSGKKLTLIKSRAIVSSRKYFTRSWLRVNFANVIAFSMFLLGKDSLKIKKIYYRILG